MDGPAKPGHDDSCVCREHRVFSEERASRPTLFPSWPRFSRAIHCLPRAIHELFVVTAGRVARPQDVDAPAKPDHDDCVWGCRPRLPSTGGRLATCALSQNRHGPVQPGQPRVVRGHGRADSTAPRRGWSGPSRTMTTVCGVAARACFRQVGARPATSPESSWPGSAGPSTACPGPRAGVRCSWSRPGSGTAVET